MADMKPIFTPMQQARLGFALEILEARRDALTAAIEALRSLQRPNHTELALATVKRILVEHDEAEAALVQERLGVTPGEGESV